MIELGLPHGVVRLGHILQGGDNIPILEWRCTECKQTFEEIRKVNDHERPPDNDPPCCAEPKYQRILGKVNIKKGASWGKGKGHW